MHNLGLEFKWRMHSNTNSFRFVLPVHCLIIEKLAANFLANEQPVDPHFETRKSFRMLNLLLLDVQV
jgi:hypothetical protein